MAQLVDGAVAGRHGCPGPGVVPLPLCAEGVEPAFLSTTAVFGTPREVIVSELAIEAFHPADAATRAALLAG